MMLGIALSADDIKAAPPGVRRWLEQQMVRSSGEQPTPELAIDPPTPPPVRCADSDNSSTFRSAIEAEAGSATKGKVRMSQEVQAARNAAIQKLIAERAYQLWENQGRAASPAVVSVSPSQPCDAA